MNNEKLIGKIRKTSTACIIAILVFFGLNGCGFLGVGLKAFVAEFKEGWNSYDASSGVSEDISFGYSAFVLLTALVIVCVFIYLIINSVRILFWVRKSENPFELRFSSELKQTGIALMILEPLTMLFEYFAVKEIPTVSGLYFASGALFLCISMIFRYGTELQKESDETL